MTTPTYPNSGLLTYRQAAHACGLTIEQLRYLVRIGEASPTYQIGDAGSRGSYLWSVTEVKRVREMQGKHAWRRRRKARLRGTTFDALQPVAPTVPRGRPPKPPT